MHRRLWSFLTLISLLCSALPLTTTLAQSESTPVTVGANELFTAEGVEIQVLASANAEALSTAAPRLLLERLVLPAQALMPIHTAALPELIFVEIGQVSIEDSLGFSTTIEAGRSLSFNTEATYELENTGSTDASVLRLSLAVFEAVTDDLSPGTPVASTSEVDIEVLIDRQVESFPFTPVTLFVAEVVFQPGSETGEQQHVGPLGIHVTDGTLSVLSPSGVEGQLDSGSGVALPGDAPLVARNTTDQETTAILVGVVETSEELFNVITPTPTPSPEPSPTPFPTPTPEPTATEESTLKPTPTP